MARTQPTSRSEFPERPFRSDFWSTAKYTYPIATLGIALGVLALALVLRNSEDISIDSYRFAFVLLAVFLIIATTLFTVVLAFARRKSWHQLWWGPIVLGALAGAFFIPGLLLADPRGYSASAKDWLSMLQLGLAVGAATGLFAVKLFVADDSVNSPPNGGGEADADKQDD